MIKKKYGLCESQKQASSLSRTYFSATGKTNMMLRDPISPEVTKVLSRSRLLEVDTQGSETGCSNKWQQTLSMNACPGR